MIKPKRGGCPLGQVWKFMGPSGGVAALRVLRAPKSLSEKLIFSG